MTRRRTLQRPGALVALALLPALAPATAPAADRGWEIGFGWGEADYGLTAVGFDDGSIVVGRVDSNELGWKLWAGYRFNRWLGIEAGYVDLVNDFDGPSFEGVSIGGGERFVSLPDGPVSVDLAPEGYFVDGVGRIELSGSWSAFGKLGVVRWRARSTTRDLTGEVVRRATGTALTYGAGFEHRWRRGLAARVEYELFTNVLDWEIDLVTVGLSYRF